MPDAPIAHKVAWTAACGGFALLPDLDMRNTTAARTWGFPTQILAVMVGKIARGHRNGTHDAVLAPFVFGSLTYFATLSMWSTLLILALSFALALKACSFAIPGRMENTVLGNLILSWGLAWFLLTEGSGAPIWLPVAVMIGVLAHIAGDALTPERVPVPMAWISNPQSRIGIPLFTTGKWGERPAAWAIGFAAAYLFALNIGLIEVFTELNNGGYT